MRVVEPSVKYFDCWNKTPSEFIELVGRTCYKSTESITEGSSYSFVKGLINRKHNAMLEHFWVHLFFDRCHISHIMNVLRVTAEDLGMSTACDIMHHIELSENQSGTYMSMPIRVPLEWADRARDRGVKCVSILSSLVGSVDPVFDYYFEGFSSPLSCVVMSEQEFTAHMRRTYSNVEDYMREVKKHVPHSILFVCDRGVSHELVRHRPCSFAQESTRYCNYSKDKFGGEIAVIKPLFFEEGDYKYESWKSAMEEAEHYYFLLLAKGATPQEARSVLPNSLKTEIIVTANEVEWQHIINLRYHGTTGAPHPQMKEVMSLAYEELIKAGANIK